MTSSLRKINSDIVVVISNLPKWREIILHLLSISPMIAVHPGVLRFK